ncbi:hypothetical protein SapgrDRAFT_3104 [Saprospira grandis DSM 2844]|uniref:Uncharacterized protein n=1 Tax=Saprospira grandis DSM 2844 TaxID=694433 RepID=J0XZU6_9BACT|nr:hypothetical protein [Saprospira grandis]EJF54751.1 hypothetical protein SapgrDRAFT_3104 [Saprospira grandis DSM 2844]
MYKYFLFFLLFVGQQLAAQRLSQNTVFEAGVYRQWEDFKANRPRVPLPDTSSWAKSLSPDGNLLLLSEASWEVLDAQGEIWGIAYREQPYIRVDPPKGPPYLVHLHVVGTISYYYYRYFKEHELPMTIYDPFSGQAVGQKVIINKEPSSKERILQFETGEQTDFNYENLRAWIKDDPGLLQSLESLKTEEYEDKLFKILLIYNDRKAVYIQQD